MTNEQLKDWLKYQLGFSKRGKERTKDGGLQLYWCGQIDAFRYILEQLDDDKYILERLGGDHESN